MAAGGEAGWSLYYHGSPMKGRGEYLRLLFEAAQVPFREVGDFPSIKALCDSFSYPALGGAPFAAYAPPVLVTPEGSSISQTTAAAHLLGRRFGLFPDSAEDESRCLQVACSVADLHSEGRQCFHPKDFFGSYYSQVEEAKVAVAAFESGRLLKWLQHFEHLLGSNGDGRGFVVGQKMTFADILLFHLLNALEAQFAAAYAGAAIPLLKAFQGRIAAFPPIAAYLASDRVRPWEGNSCN